MRDQIAQIRAKPRSTETCHICSWNQFPQPVWDEIPGPSALLLGIYTTTGWLAWMRYLSSGYEKISLTNLRTDSSITRGLLCSKHLSFCYHFDYRSQSQHKLERFSGRWLHICKLSRNIARIRSSYTWGIVMPRHAECTIDIKMKSFRFCKKQYTFHTLLCCCVTNAPFTHFSAVVWHQNMSQQDFDSCQTTQI